jgi:hypothetical protein
MAILVDDPLWWRHDRHWCHMVSDASIDELHLFAAALGVPERGFHRDHYDIPHSLRQTALEMGATAVSSRELVRRLRASGLRAVPRVRDIDENARAPEATATRHHPVDQAVPGGVEDHPQLLEEIGVVESDR